MNPIDLTHPGLLISIVNHENTENALRLASRFRECAKTLLIDSGSALTGEEVKHFDVVLPNVYYAGLFNESLRQTLNRPDIEILLFVCSDVTTEDASLLVDRLAQAFSDDSIGVYTPSCTGRSLEFCRRLETGALREIPFVDGFIFAVRRSVLRELQPIDVDVNLLGWGIDVRISYVAASMQLRTVVDDGVAVYHPPDCGYDQALAFDQMTTWLASHGDGSLRYFQLSRRLKRLSRYRLSRLAQGVVSPLELKLFRLLARRSILRFRTSGRRSK
ncbi:MAG TPA: hypothetical protein VMO47_00775 [Rhodothermales bacterium]|nr:hypothetical protein [Rhodothermales bacterium]